MLDVMVFTAHRRGEYLIEQLQQSDIRFQVFDFTRHLGERDEKDLLGPFGFFAGEKAKMEYRAWMEKMYVFSKQKQGLTFFTDQGLLETTGLVSDYQKKQLTGMALSLGTSLLSTIDFPLRSLPDREPFCDVFSDYYLPWTIHNARTKAMEVSGTFHFETRPGVKTLHCDGRDFTSAHVMSFLSGAELMVLQNQGMASLMVQEPLRPRMCWQRAEIILSSDVDMDVMPLQTVFAPHFEEPWLDTGFFILHRQENEGYYSLWFRTWFERHGSQEHFSQLAKAFEKTLAKHIPGAKTQWTQLPFETQHEDAISLYPIFDLKEWNSQKKWLENGVYQGGADKLQNYLWSHNLSHQESLVTHFTQFLQEQKK